jgi:hypothetical protein
MCAAASTRILLLGQACRAASAAADCSSLKPRWGVEHNPMQIKLENLDPVQGSLNMWLELRLGRSRVTNPSAEEIAALLNQRIAPSSGSATLAR